MPYTTIRPHLKMFAKVSLHFTFKFVNIHIHVQFRIRFFDDELIESISSEV